MANQEKFTFWIERGQQEIHKKLDALEAFLKTEPAIDAVHDWIAKSGLMQLALYKDTLGVGEYLRLTGKVLHRLGQYNVALSVGYCMNQYILLSLALMPTQEGSTLHTMRGMFSQMIKSSNLLLGVSSFDDLKRGKNDAPNQLMISKTDKGFRCTGTKNFQSLASYMDVLLFSALDDEGEVHLCFAPVKGVDEISFSDPVFGPEMRDSDTRMAHFDGMNLAAQQVIPNVSVGDQTSLHDLTRIIFGILAMCPYLGGAKRALDEARDFQNNKLINGKPLSALEGHILARGKTEMAYAIAMDLIEMFCVEADKNLEIDFEAWAVQAQLASLRIKHHVSGKVKDILDYSVSAIGTRAFLDGNIVGLLSQQMNFASLHPIFNHEIERAWGAKGYDIGESA